jgi:superfamily II DNA or RNA helicase
MIGVSARPFSKSLSSHIQQMGRVMRSYDGKEFALWLDHSGNYLRFREEWDEVYESGVNKLNDKQEKAKKEPTEKVKKESKCPKCEALWPKNSDTCFSCGFVRQKRNQVSSIAGELIELGAAGKSQRQEKQVFYSELLYIAKERNYNEHWASHKYREKFGVWPKGLSHDPTPPTIKTANWIKSRNIAWAKKSQKKTPTVNLDWKNK